MFNRNDHDAPRRLGSGEKSRIEDRGAEDGHNLMAVIHERLSGRWKWATALGIVLACGAGVLGYRAASIKYESTGIIHVAPKASVIMREIPETGMLPRYPSYVQTQATLLSSPRVLDRAYDSLSFDDNPPWNDRLQGIRIIRSGLKANVQRDSELIHVSYLHEQPVVAQKVLNAVIRAYTELHASADGDDVNQTLRKLRNLREGLRNQRFQRQSQIQELIAASEFPFHDLDDLISQKASRIETLDSQIRQLQHLQQITDARRETSPVQQASSHDDDRLLDPVTGSPIDSRDLEAFDPELQRLRRAKDEAETALEHARERFTDRHRAFRAAQDNYRIATRMYQQRMERTIEQFLDAERVPAENWAMQPAQRLVQLNREVEQERSIIADMQRTQLAMHELRSEIDDIRHEEREITARIRDLDREADSLRRITVASFGELPASPAQDRRIPFAAVGAMAGMGMGFGFFFLLASLDRRVYGVAQLGGASTQSNLLGVLPALLGSSADLEASGVAAHCVHQIRNRIESARKPGRSVVLAISSPYQGDGKTSLTLALAASYAASGSRTVLVDCDMVGRSLTHNLMMNNRPGVQECLRGRADAEQLVQPLPPENLCMVPVGDDTSFGPECVRKADMEMLFQRLRRSYDVILVDTGPLIGSVESLPVVGAADGVILAMWRGRRQSRLDECIKAIHAAGSEYLGLVLNYAMASDCNRYLSCSKASTPPETSNGSTNGARNGTHSRTNNALMQAMQATTHPRPRPRQRGGSSRSFDT